MSCLHDGMRDVPRASGDEPYIKGNIERLSTYSPHSRGADETPQSAALSCRPRGLFVC